MELEELLSYENGRILFLDFLRKEFSQENLEFFLECQRLKNVPKTEVKLIKKMVRTIYEKYVSLSGPKAINIDGSTLKMIKNNLSDPGLDIFEAAEKHIFDLMKNDSYPRFLQSDQYKSFLKSIASNSCRKRKFLKLSPSNDRLSKTDVPNLRNLPVPVPSQRRFIRVILPDTTQHLIPAIQEYFMATVIQDLLQKQGLGYSHFKLFSVPGQEEIDLYESVSAVRATEIRVEPFVLFSIHFPEGYQVCVETNRNQLAYYAINTILTKFGIGMDDVELTATCLGVLCRNSLMRAVAILDGQTVQVNYFSSLRTYVDLGDFNDLNQDSEDVIIRSVKYKKRHRSEDTLSIDCQNRRTETKSILQPFYENLQQVEQNVVDLGNLSFSNEVKTEEFLNNILTSDDPSKINFSCTPKKDSEECYYENVPLPKSDSKNLHRARLAVIEDVDEEPFYENQEIFKNNQNLNRKPPIIASPFSKYLCQNSRFENGGRRRSLTRNSPSRRSIRPSKRLQPDLVLSSTTHRTCPIKTLSRFHKIE